MKSKSNSHFTDLMVTKDTSGNADFIFGVDMDRMVIDNSLRYRFIKTDGRNIPVRAFYLAHRRIHPDNKQATQKIIQNEKRGICLSVYAGKTRKLRVE